MTSCRDLNWKYEKLSLQRSTGCVVRPEQQQNMVTQQIERINLSDNSEPKGKKKIKTEYIGIVVGSNMLAIAPQLNQNTKFISILVWRNPKLKCDADTKCSSFLLNRPNHSIQTSPKNRNEKLKITLVSDRSHSFLSLCVFPFLSFFLCFFVFIENT